MEREKIRIGLERDDKRIAQIVDIHMRTFEGFFLTFLGRGFLKQLYRGFIKHNASNLFVAEDEEGAVLGFLAYSEDISDFYKWLLRKRLFAFAWYSLLALFRNPRVLLRLLRAFLKPGESQRVEPYLELASIGVSPESKGLGIGSRLIERLKETVDFTKYAYIKLETDADGNEAVNGFYQKNGFVIDHPYETSEGRKMYEYRCHK